MTKSNVVKFLKYRKSLEGQTVVDYAEYKEKLFMAQVEDILPRIIPGLVFTDNLYPEKWPAKDSSDKDSKKNKKQVANPFWKPIGCPDFD
jgi:hypothetical protein